MGGILNSTFAVLSKFQYGRPVGNEGNLKTEVVDVTMMPVPDPRRCSAQTVTRVAKAFDAMKGREAFQLLSERRMRSMAFSKVGKENELINLSETCELDMSDRHELDDAIFEMMGVTSKRERQDILGRLYVTCANFCSGRRKKAILNGTFLRKPTIPAEIA